MTPRAWRITAAEGDATFGKFQFLHNLVDGYGMSRCKRPRFGVVAPWTGMTTACTIHTRAPTWSIDRRVGHNLHQLDVRYFFHSKCVSYLFVGANIRNFSDITKQLCKKNTLSSDRVFSYTHITNLN